MSGKDELDFDPDVLRARYRAERDRRVRPEGSAQYQQTTGDFGYYVEDPYVEPGFTRAPLRDRVDVAIIGGGFSGLVAAARLREAGVGDIRVIDKAGDFGGTWYWNRYPGARCDIESYIYLPLLEEVGYLPTEKYTLGPENRQYAQAIGQRFDLYRDACFQTGVTELRWDETECAWLIRTDRDDHMRARYVVIASGAFSRPKLPGIPGIETFGGHTFHTSRWDYGYTGGNADGGMDKIADKRVAIIGSGATAIQCVPHLGREAGHLYVVQRTPSSVGEARNAPTDPEWANTLEPGWQRRRMDNFFQVVSGSREIEDLVADRWTEIYRSLENPLPDGRVSDLPADQAELAAELADFRKMNEIRARIDSVVEDPATAEALKPWYRQMCKRPTFSDDYLTTFNRPNVTLIDTASQEIDRISERGIVVGGVEHEVDCVIFATGFAVSIPHAQRMGLEVFGRDGVTLTEYWGRKPRTLHGFYSNGFPNCFHMSGMQQGVTPNYTHIVYEQAAHIADVVAEAEKRQARYVEPTAEAEADWVDTLERKAHVKHKYLTECTPGYSNNEGSPGDGKNIYGGGPIEFYELIRRWRTDGGWGEVFVD